MGHVHQTLLSTYLADLKPATYEFSYLNKLTCNPNAAFVIPGMSCAPYMPSAATVSQSRRLIMRSSLYGFSSEAWKRASTWHSGIRPINPDAIWTRFPIRCYSARRTPASLPLTELDSGPAVVTEKDAFYVVRKGDLVAIYKSLSDCQAQVGSSVCYPSVSVYKGYSLRKESEEYLTSFGLKNASYSINSVDVKEDLFGTLVPCPFQQPDGIAFSTDKASQIPSSLKRTTEDVELDNSLLSCILEFDGASKGNPGKGGAGAILRSEDGSVVSRAREGLGVVTNNVAEYRAMILGMKCALKRGFMNIRVQGDSKLVCLQVQKLWRTRHANLIDHYKEAKELKDKFLSFEICHVKREFNADADVQANLASHLPEGEVYEEDLAGVFTSISSK